MTPQVRAVPTAAGTTRASSYQHKPPPYFIRVATGGLIYLFAKTFSRLGNPEKMFARMHARRERQYAKQNPFKDYVPGKQDVFVATYAKSGTNWMMQIAVQLIYHGKAEFDHIHSLVPWPDIALMGGFMRGYAIPLEQATGWQTAPEHKRVIKTHFNWSEFPYSDDARYIMVIRDPKDVVVSNYHFFGSTAVGLIPPMETWLKIFLAGNTLGGSWAANAVGFWAQRHRPNVLVLSFKSMKKDLRGTVLKVADFLDIHVSDAVIDEVCAKSSFDYMKRIDDKFRNWAMLPWDPDPVMIRKGAQGGSSELLRREQQRQIDAHFIAELERMGSDFPYEEFCDLA